MKTPKISQEEYDRLLAAQGGGCAICGNKPRTRKLSVDHDHESGKIIGLLCVNCNRYVGWLETPQRIIGAIKNLQAKLASRQENGS